jgi:hypothetical protein
MNLRLTLLCTAVAFWGVPALAQHGDHGAAQHGDHGAAQHASPYAGEEAREIKALSPNEVSDLLNGAGMGFAKAAELNRYPGPLHVLEHAKRLGLSEAQQVRIAGVLTRHKERARALGEQMVALERELDELFAKGAATPATVDRLAAALGQATGKLRAEHLKTHLETTTMLTPAQVDLYVKVRGY